LKRRRQNVSFKYVPQRKDFSNEKGNNFSRRKSATKGIKLVRGAIIFEEKGITLPQTATSPNEQRNFPEGQGIFLKEKETKW
jgi:hypothetical protein